MQALLRDKSFAHIIRPVLTITLWGEWDWPCCRLSCDLDMGEVVGQEESRLDVGSGDPKGFNNH